VTRKRWIVGLVTALALVLAACIPPPPPPPPPPPVPLGFDNCAAPSVATMRAWWGTSPYTSYAPYLGGVNRACAQPNLTNSWVHEVAQQGWQLVPTWVGPQPSCSLIANTAKFSDNLDDAWWSGVREALAAADAAAKLDLLWLAPIYYDMEPYLQGGACGAAAMTFMSAWTFTLHHIGYRSGFYGNLCFGLGDAAAAYDDTHYIRADAIWIANWNGTPNLYGFGAPCPLPDTVWNDHARIHQYLGGHDEVWNGQLLNVDVNVVDGPTAQPY
jgi:hypothetical protein